MPSRFSLSPLSETQSRDALGPRRQWKISCCCRKWGRSETFYLLGKKIPSSIPSSSILKKYLPGYSVINLIRLLIHCLQKTINTDFIAQFYSTIILTLDPLPVPHGIIKLSPFLRNLIPSSLLTHPPHRIFLLLRYPLCRQLTSLSYAQNNFFLPSSYFVTSPRPADVSKLSCSPTLSPNY